MEKILEDKFIEGLDQNMGIAHKVCNIYFPGSDEQEDIIQEMVYQLWKAYPAFRGSAKFSTWMYRVCLNTAITHLRKNRKNRNERIAPEHYAIPDSGDSSAMDLAALRKAIEGLSPVNKAIILLYLEDLSYQEIAEITGMTKSNISVRLVRIKDELGKKVKQLEEI